MSNAKDFTLQCILTTRQNNVEFLLHHRSHLLRIHTRRHHRCNCRASVPFWCIERHSQRFHRGTGRTTMTIVTGEDSFESFFFHHLQSRLHCKNQIDCRRKWSGIFGRILAIHSQIKVIPWKFRGFVCFPSLCTHRYKA